MGVGDSLSRSRGHPEVLQQLPDSFNSTPNLSYLCSLSMITPMNPPPEVPLLALPGSPGIASDYPSVVSRVAWSETPYDFCNTTTLAYSNASQDDRLRMQELGEGRVEQDEGVWNTQVC